MTASSNVDYAFTSGSGDVQRTAYGTAASTACYRLGSFVAAVNSGDSTVLAPLNDLFGVNLRLVGYQGLANTNLTLGELATTSAIGSPDQLLAGSVTYASLLRAMIEVLSRPGVSHGDKASVDLAIEALQAMLRSSAAIGSVNLGQVFHVSPADVAALDIGVNVLDIVGSAQLANGSHFIEIPNIWAGVAGLGNNAVSGSLSIISAAAMACGKPNTPESEASTAQIRGNLSFNPNLNSLNLDLGIGTLKTPRVQGTLAVEVGGATGRLVDPPSVYCGAETDADPTTYSVAVASSLATYRLTFDVTAEGDLKVGDLIGLGLGNLLDGLLGGLLGGNNNKTAVEVKVQLSIGTPGNPGTSTANLEIPPNDVTPETTGSSVYLNPTNIVARVDSVKIGGKSITNLPLASALTDLVVDRLTYLGNDFVDKTVSPLLSNLDQVLIGPVARMLGLRFGGADVYAVGAKCGLPRLSG